jgi:hypothetical protein
MARVDAAFTPEGYPGSYGRLTQPFASVTAVAPYGYPTPWWGAPPTEAYNASAAYTSLAGLRCSSSSERFC